MSLDSAISTERRSPTAPRSVPELSLDGTLPILEPSSDLPARQPASPIPELRPSSSPRSPLAQAETPGSRARPVAMLAGLLVAALLVGRFAGTPTQTLLHNKMLPWILGRSLGVATYLSITAMVFLGLWLRHPWRARFRRPGPESILWAHVSLAACTVALLAGHLTALALDRYAGVGWTGVFVPWGAQYRPTAVALGTLAFYLLLLVIGTAALAGSIGRAVWFPIHTASVVVFCMTLAHGVLSGSDGTSLRWVYVASGLVVLTLQFTRWLAGTLGHGSAVVDE